MWNRFVSFCGARGIFSVWLHAWWWQNIPYDLCSLPFISFESLDDLKDFFCCKNKWEITLTFVICRLKSVGVKIHPIVHYLPTYEKRPAVGKGNLKQSVLNWRCLILCWVKASSPLLPSAVWYSVARDQARLMCSFQEKNAVSCINFC